MSLSYTKSSGSSIKTPLFKKVNKLSFIKLKNFCSLKDNVKRIETQDIDWEKISAYLIFDKGFVYRIKNSPKHDNRKQAGYKDVSKIWKRYFIKMIY